jgi:protein TonB
VAAHADILDQPERLRGAFLGSLTFHISLAVLTVGYSVVVSTHRERWGDPNGGGFGSVTIKAVNTIPLPARTGPMNPVANDTESMVPEAPSKTKPQKKVAAPPLKAIPIPSKNATKQRPTQTASSAPNRYVIENPPAPNQLTSTVGQRTNTPMYAIQGAGGVGVGSSSPLGTQFGAYATLLRDRVAQNWHTADVDSRIHTAPPVTLVFTIRRNGSLVPGSVRVAQGSGNSTIDRSAMRAIMDAAPFQELPAGYNKDQAELELTFELRR